MDCEKDVLRIQKKLDKIVKEELVTYFNHLTRHVAVQAVRYYLNVAGPRRSIGLLEGFKRSTNQFGCFD